MAVGRSHWMTRFWQPWILSNIIDSTTSRVLEHLKEFHAHWRRWPGGRIFTHPHFLCMKNSLYCRDWIDSDMASYKSMKDWFRAFQVWLREPDDVISLLLWHTCRSVLQPLYHWFTFNNVLVDKLAKCIFQDIFYTFILSTIRLPRTRFWQKTCLCFLSVWPEGKSNHLKIVSTFF